MGTLIALTYMLTLEDPHRFRKSRDVGSYLGLQPGRRNSGQSEPQMHISKEGDPYLRTLLVQGAQHILGPFGIDCDLRRWGLKLAERGGKSGAMLRQLSGRPIALNSRRWLARTTRIGVDFHPEFQQIAAVDTDTGEVQEKRLAHREDAEAFSLHLL